MKVKKTKNKLAAIVLCGCMLLGGAATVLAQGVDGVLIDGSYLRAIKANYLEEKEGKVSADSLEPNSKWREVPDEIPEWSELDDPNATLKDHLKTVLGDDLTNTDGCEQVWEFSAEEYDDVRDWCLSNPKGEDTNQVFLDTFKERNCKQKK